MRIQNENILETVQNLGWSVKIHPQPYYLFIFTTTFNREWSRRVNHFVRIKILILTSEYKSKRLSLHQKYKIERKVREHNRQQRRDAKKNPDSRKSIYLF